MAWIESHQALGRHPKLISLAGALKVSRRDAVGLLHYLWWWAIDYAPSGDLSQRSDVEIAGAAEWDGDPAQLRAALVSARFIDADTGYLHDWDAYAGRLISSRKRDAKRKRDVRRTSGGRPPAVHSTDTTDIPNPTYPTQPNQPTKAVRLGWFKALWVQYPSKDGRKAAEKHFLATVETAADHARIQQALARYLGAERVKRGFVKNGSTWFNNWADWVDFTETPKGVAHGPTGNGFRGDGAHVEGDRKDAVVL